MGQNVAPDTALSDNNIFDPYVMVAILRRLSKILTEEIALLKDMRIKDIHQFYDDKIELAAILESYKEIFNQNPQFLKSIPKRVMSQIKEEAERFEALVVEDEKHITRAKQVHGIVMEAVRLALEKNTIKSSGYNKKGLIELGYRGTYITPPVSVNENI